jgi:hypothetical protein
MGVKASDTAVCESSACLLLALQQSPSGGGSKLEDLGLGSSVQNFPVNSTISVPALGDHWNRPVLFCRWPTGNAVPLGNSAAGQNGAANDPGDPEGTLTVQGWQQTIVPAWKQTCYTKFVSLCHYIPPRTSAGAPPRSNVVVPLIASAGPDAGAHGLVQFQQYLGLNLTDFSSQGTGAENDNLYSRP